MDASCAEIGLFEWSHATPDTHPELRGLSFDGHPRARDAAKRLADQDRIEVLELRTGLSIATNSHVGTIRLGPVRIAIRPKIRGGQLLRLLRYAFGLRDLGLVSEVDEALLDRLEFQDVLILQLEAEAEELIRRGLRRQHVPVDEWRSDPRGRFDFAALARSGRPGDMRLPCHHFDRSADTALNRVLLAGLRKASDLAQDAALAGRVRHLAGLLQDEVGSVRLDAALLGRCRLGMDRLTRAYEPAVRLIEALLDEQGATPEGQASDVPLAGFLFDMNAFFERLLDRFLSENLPECDVRLQHRLTDMFLWEASESGARRRPPSPRPDYVVIPRTGRRAVLDAKYRDLGATTLPREMLYQLAMYSFCHGAENRSTILYPSMREPKPGTVSEERLLIRDPVTGKPISQLNLRGVPIPRLAELVVERPGDPTVERGRQEMARLLAFGQESASGAAAAAS